MKVKIAAFAATLLLSLPASAGAWHTDAAERAGLTIHALQAAVPGTGFDRLKTAVDEAGTEYVRVELSPSVAAFDCRDPLGNLPTPTVDPATVTCTINWSHASVQKALAVVSAMDSIGVKVMLLPIGAPCWMRPSTDTDADPACWPEAVETGINGWPDKDGDHAYTPGERNINAVRPDLDGYLRTYYGRFLALALEHFDATYPGTVRAVEVYNEPNLMSFWGTFPNGAGYADLLQQSAAAISAEAVAEGHASSYYAVVLGGPAGIHDDVYTQLPNNGGPYQIAMTAPDFLDRVWDNLPNPANAHYNAIGLHPYPTEESCGTNGCQLYDWINQTFDGGNVVDQVQEIRTDAVAHPRNATASLWLTEIGYPTFGPDAWRNVTESQQATLIDRTLDYAVTKSWVQGLFVFGLADHTDPTAWWQGTGMLRNDPPTYSEKPAYSQLCANWLHIGC